jgi:hypothetical protein
MLVGAETETIGELMAQFLDETSLLREAARAGSLTASAARTTMLQESVARARYDFFLCHAKLDERLIKAIRDRLVSRGYSVYVDWIDDAHLDRESVSELTAETLRRRMDSADALLFVSTQASTQSVWMPWELGYFDGSTGPGHIGIVPIFNVGSGQPYQGQEYLDLYPQFQAEDLTVRSDFVVTDTSGRVLRRVGSLRARR